MGDYELSTQRFTTITRSSLEEEQFREAPYAPSQLSYEPVRDREEADDSYLTATSVDRSRAKRRPSRFKNVYTGDKLQSTPRQLLWTWITALASCLWMAFTTLFAFNCSLPKPLAASLLPPRSEDSLLILNILSHGMVLLLGLLTSQAFETVRRALASSKKGIPVGSFLGLSRATGLLGVISVLFNGKFSGFLKLDGPQFWSMQRYFFPSLQLMTSLFLLLLNTIIGIALLSNISIVSSWKSVESIDISASGLSPINASIAQTIYPGDFWDWIYSLLPSPNYVFPITPTRCSLA
jgi:hypothetical protein